MDVDSPSSSSSRPLASPTSPSTKPSSAASSSASSAGFKGKFKLDPMSLLLPHERKMYQQQAQKSDGAGAERGPPKASVGVQPRTAMGTGGDLRDQQSSGEQSKSMKFAAEACADRLSEGMYQAPGVSGAPISPPASNAGYNPPTTQWETGSQGSSTWSNAGMDPTTSSPYTSTASRRQPHVPQPHSGKAQLGDWEIVETLGTGTFGRVMLVRQRPNYRPTAYHPIFPHLYQQIDPLTPSPSATSHLDGQLPHFAMKVLRKSEIVRLKQVEHINSERKILKRIRHPFVVELYATYQDQQNVYMLLSYVPGGELFSHLRRAGRFSADVTRFYLASIVLAIEYLHARNIIYRDLKPENLLLDRVGYLRITDFGFAKVVEDRTFTLCGTPEYLAPEIVLSQGHGKAVDWWALGILAFEMLAGYPPFFDDHPLGIYEKILRNEVAFPAHIDPYAKDLIRGLLTADRSKRLGNLRGGAKDVMGHAWFAGVDWGSLERKEIGAPIVPRVVSMGECGAFSRRAAVRLTCVQATRRTSNGIPRQDRQNSRGSLESGTILRPTSTRSSLRTSLSPRVRWGRTTRGRGGRDCRIVQSFREAGWQECKV